MKFSSFKRLETFSFLAKDNNIFINIGLAVCDAAKVVKFGASHRQSKCFVSAPEESNREDLQENALEAIKSKRLFFEPSDTSSILDATKFPFRECVAISMESYDPYADFRISIEEIVETCGLKGWEHVEELLACYLRMNDVNNHCLIVKAFVDVFTAGAAPSSSSSSQYASASSSKSEDWWEIEDRSVCPSLEKGKCQVVYKNVSTLD